MITGLGRVEIGGLAQNLADTLADASDKATGAGGEPMSAFSKGALVGICTEWLEDHFLAEDGDTAASK